MEPIESRYAEEEAPSLFHKAAKGSWTCTICALLAMLLPIGALKDILAFGFIGVGLVLGLVALSGIPRYGTKGILIPALIGVLLNGGYGYIGITNFNEARRRTIEAREQREEQSRLMIQINSTMG